MKRLVTLCLLAAITLGSVLPAEAARRKVVRKGPHKRVTVVVRTGHPIRRAMPTVVVRRPSVAVRVAAASFLPVLVWAPVVVARPGRDALVWEDSETLFAEEGWSETVFDANARGEALHLEVVSGKVQFDFAEVVFENGDCRVVDFNNAARGPGLYRLLDFADGRRVDHVRLIARAKSDESKVALIMRK